MSLFDLEGKCVQCGRYEAELKRLKIEFHIPTSTCYSCIKGCYKKNDAQQELPIKKPTIADIRAELIVVAKKIKQIYAMLDEVEK